MSNNKDFKVKNGIKPTVYHEGLGTVVSGSVGYNLAGASYDSVSFSVASQDTNPYGLFFKTDGTKLYVVGDIGNSVYQYTCSSAWDVSTATYDSVSFSISGQEDLPTGIFFKPDGTQMYISGQRGDDLNQYTLSTAWDLSTASYASKNLLLNQSTNPYGCFFKPDGTKFYSIDAASNTVYQYTLSTAWDVSTASYDSVSFSVASQETAATLLYFNSDGTIMYAGGQISDSLFEYPLSTAYDISTAVYSGTSYLLASQDSSPTSIYFKPDGTKMYMLGLANDTIYQYSTVLNTAQLDLSTGSVFDYTPTSDVQVTLSNPAASGTVSGATLLLDGAGTTGYDLANGSYDNVSFSVASQDANPYGLTFNNDGTKMYMSGANSDSVYQYSLSTSFDLSTASYDSVSFSVAGQDTIPREIAFNNNGTKMYMIGPSSDSVYQYSLSTAFDLSTASYDSISFSVSSQDTNPSSVAFNSDGTKMYMVGVTNDSVHQYSLSTAFNLSTTSYDSVSFSVAGQDTNPYGIDFNNAGTKMYILGLNNLSVYQYSLSTAFNLSTASYDSVSFSLASQDATPLGVAFNSDGTKMYMVGNINNNVFQYSTATPATITYDTAIEWPSGTAPTSPAIGETDVVTFNTRDGGSTYQGVLAINGAK